MSNMNTRLLLPEYGRNVQKMVQYLKTIENKEQRNKQAEVVVGIMSTLYPGKKDSDEFKNMLWDHLFMIADFDLNIDSPYPIPCETDFNPKPDPIPYSQSYISQKHYGKFARKMIKAVALASQDTEEDKMEVTTCMAKFLKQKSFEYNNEHPDNAIIINAIRDFSDGMIDLGSGVLDNTQVVVKPNLNKQKNNNGKNNFNRKNKKPTK